LAKSNLASILPATLTVKDGLPSPRFTDGQNATRLPEFDYDRVANPHSCRSPSTQGENAMPYRISIVILTALMCFAATTQAEEIKTAQAGATFESLDKDSNGKIDLNEASDNDDLFVAFKNLDKNRDGALTKDEFATYKGGKSGA
jgi:hypothetical protein